MPDGHGGEIDLERAWRTATLHELVSEAVGEPVDPGTPLERLVELAARARGRAAARLGRRRGRPGAVRAAGRAHPAAADLRARLPGRACARWPAPHRDDPRLAEAWDLIVAGVELGTAYSELVDPVEQRRRLTEQSLKAAGGDPEAMQLDEDFLRALEHGMPPTGGMGMGVDRLVMLLTGLPIRETILFPLVRPE